MKRVFSSIILVLLMAAQAWAASGDICAMQCCGAAKTPTHGEQGRQARGDTNTATSHQAMHHSHQAERQTAQLEAGKCAIAPVCALNVVPSTPMGPRPSELVGIIVHVDLDGTVVRSSRSAVVIMGRASPPLVANHTPLRI